MNLGRPTSIDRPQERSLTTAIRVHLVVAAARLLAKRSPDRIEKVMSLAAKGAQPASYLQIRDTQRTVLSVSAICAGDGCLHRSISVALLCRMTGTFPEWKTGIQMDPFRAHAWVQAEGKSADHGMDPDTWIELITVTAGGHQ